MDEGEKNLVRQSLRAALALPPDDLAEILAAFGWAELARTDEAFAVTTLFEELGRAVLDTEALDLATTVLAGLDEDLAVLWPLSGLAAPGSTDASAAVDGVALRSVVGAQRLYVAGSDGLRLLEVTSLTQRLLGGMAEGTGWVRVQATGALGPPIGDEGADERRFRLALSSELVGLSERTIAVAVEHVTGRQQFGQPIGAYQAVRFRLAEAYAEMVGARALVEAAWEDGSPSSITLAHAGACGAADAVGKQALQVCGAIGFSAEHALPGLVKRAFALAALLPPCSPQQIGAALERVPVPVGSF